jgi:hypothetical protein
VSILDRKLRRELVSMRAQVLTIALVVAAGVAVFVAAISTYDSLKSAQSRFYASARFPDIFVTLKRAPLAIVPRLTAIPGVAAVQPRIVRDGSSTGHPRYAVSAAWSRSRTEASRWRACIAPVCRTGETHGDRRGVRRSQRCRWATISDHPQRRVDISGITVAVPEHAYAVRPACRFPTTGSSLA